MKRRYIVEKAAGVGGEPIPPDEPCLVIRAQDRLAHHMLEHYIEAYEYDCPSPDPAVVADLRDHEDALISWQDRNPTKWADR